MVPFANWLQGKINRRGWSVERTAREAGIPPSTLEAILRGERSPDYQDCQLLSEALRLSPLTVCYRAGILSDPDPEIDEALRLIAQLPGWLQKFVLLQIQWLAKRVEAMTKK